MAAAQLFLPASRAFNSNGLPVAGAVLKLYTTGTNTPQPFYSDDTLTTSLGFTVTANAAGHFQAVYQDNITPFRLRIEDSFGAELDDIDPYYFGRMTFSTVASSGVAGLFVDASAVTIPDDVDLVVTTGFSTLDSGGALYVRDAGFDVATYPLAGFTSANGVVMRLSGEQDVNPFMFGAVDCTGTPKGADEAVSDCIAALNAMWAFVKHLATLNIFVEMDLSDCLGLGVSAPWLLSTGNDGATWNANTFRIKGGRLVAMANMATILEYDNRNFEVSGVFELWGGTDTQLNSGNYSQRYAKNGVTVRDIGGSRMGDYTIQGVRRFGVLYDKNVGGLDNNNIPTQWGKIIVVQAGCRTTDTVKFAGTYASGSWTNTGGHSDSYAQRHRLTLTPNTGCDPTDLEVGDLVEFNTTSVGCVMAIASSTSTTITVDIYPWISTEVSGTFQSAHGGGLSIIGGNTANTTIELLETFSCGTGLQSTSLYGAKIGSLLTESTLCGVQLGMAGLESMEGLSVEHFHIENVDYSIIDCAAAGSGLWFGTPSNLEGTNRGKFDKCLRLNPARYSAGWQAPVRTSMCGVGFRMNGGSVESPRNLNIEYNDSGANSAFIGNSPEYQSGPCYANTFDFYLIAERSLSEKLSNRHSRMVEWGPIYGSGTHGAPTGNVTFQIWSGDLLGGSTTIDGGATKVLTSADGALQGVAVYEPPASGNNGDWKIFSWKATGA